MTPGRGTNQLRHQEKMLSNLLSCVNMQCAPFFPAFMGCHPCWDKVLVMQLFGKIISVPLKNPHKTCWRLSILWSVVGSLLGVCDIPSHLPENSTKLQFPNHLTLPVHTMAKTEGRHTGPTYRNPCSSPFTCGILI